jgi:hypothetical protein
MRFVKNPTEITAEIFDGKTFPTGIEFRLVAGTWEIYNALHDSWVKLKIGDYYRTDVPGDHYPIDKDYMAANYTEKTDPIQRLEKWGYIVKDYDSFFHIIDETGETLFSVSAERVTSHLYEKTDLNAYEMNTLFSLQLLLRERKESTK